MRFNHKSKSTFYPGCIRYRCKYLLFPKRIRNQTRWLEKATWKETRSVVSYGLSKIPAKRKFKYVWSPTEWVDKT